MESKKPACFYDAGGEKYKHPERSCKNCIKWENMSCLIKKIKGDDCLDYAKYGCRKYDNGDKS